MKQGRLGYTESTLLFCNYLRNELKIEITEEFVKYEASFLQWLFNTSGFFDLSFNYNYDYIQSPIYQNLMKEFFQMSKQNDFTRFLIHDTSLSIYRPGFYSNFNIKQYNFDDVLNEFKDFVKDKRILIINPMAKLIKTQHDNGNLYKINVLPQIKSIECYVNEYTFFNKSDSKKSSNSFEYVDSIIPNINEYDVDCVIISCGAISSLLANRINKDYLIIGSDLLTIFGIKHDRIKEKYAYNQHWIDVPNELKPSEYKLVENGCYW